VRSYAAASASDVACEAATAAEVARGAAPFLLAPHGLALTDTGTILLLLRDAPSKARAQSVAEDAVAPPPAPASVGASAGPGTGASPATSPSTSPRTSPGKSEPTSPVTSPLDDLRRSLAAAFPRAPTRQARTIVHVTLGRVVAMDPRGILAANPPGAVTVPHAAPLAAPLDAAPSDAAPSDAAPSDATSAPDVAELRASERRRLQTRANALLAEALQDGCARGGFPWAFLVKHLDFVVEHWELSAMGASTELPLGPSLAKS